jgi:hypothetical protein
MKGKLQNQKENQKNHNLRNAANRRGKQRKEEQSIP